MRIIPSALAMLKERSTCKPRRNDAGFLEVGGDFRGECAEQRDVGAYQRVFAHVLRAVCVSVFVVNVAERINPPLLVDADEVNELIRDDC